MVIERMRVRRQLEQLINWCALLLTAWFLGLGIGAANAGNATWVWPTQRVNNVVASLAEIGGFTVYDVDVPVANFPGLAVTACTALIPPTTPTGTCTAPFTVGHHFVIVVGDNSTPPTFSAPSAAVVAVTAVSPLKPATGLVVIGP